MAARLVIEGGVPLRGEVRVSAAKNAALPLLAASLLSAEPVVLENVPATGRHRHDPGAPRAARDRDRGAGRAHGRADAAHSGPSRRRTSWSRRCAPPSWSWGRSWPAPGGPASRCPAAARSGRGRSTCTSRASSGSGPRSTLSQGYVEARAARLKGARIVFDLVTVTGTENLMMAAAPRRGHHDPRERGAGARDPGPRARCSRRWAHGSTARGPSASRSRACRSWRRPSPDHPGPRRGGDLPRGRGDHGRRRHGPRRGAGPPERRSRQARGDRGRASRSAPTASGSARTGRPRPTDVVTNPVPGLRDGHAGPDHGAPGAGRGLERDHRDDLREPLHARGRAAPPRGGDRDRRQPRGDPGRARLSGRAGHGDRPPRLRVARARRPGGRGHDRGVARLSPRPRATRAWSRSSCGSARACAGKGEACLDAAAATTTAPAHPGAAEGAAAPAGARSSPAGRASRVCPRTTVARLLFTDPTNRLRLLILKPLDVPTYVEHGAADLGIVGKDVLLEQEPDVYEPLDLGFGVCRLVVAEPRELWERDDPAKWSWVRVATKYPNLTRRYFAERGIQVEVVRLDGSIELAPLVGLAERIVDLVQSGETLRANGLVEVAEILPSTARLIVEPRGPEDSAPRGRSAPGRAARGGARVIRVLRAADLGRRRGRGGAGPAPRGHRSGHRRRGSPRSSTRSGGAATRRCSTSPSASTASSFAPRSSGVARGRVGGCDRPPPARGRARRGGPPDRGLPSPPAPALVVGARRARLAARPAGDAARPGRVLRARRDGGVSRRPCS